MKIEIVPASDLSTTYKVGYWTLVAGIAALVVVLSLWLV